MKWMVLIAGVFAATANAQAVVVKSGDHADFTRLVLTFPAAAEWEMGRTDLGYGLSRSNSSEAYDLTDVYRLITKERLKSIWVDPKTGLLQLGVTCKCHAIPFEFRADTLVIDIRDGAPPPGSVFEQSIFTGKPLPPLGPPIASITKPTVPPQKAYDWLDAAPDGYNNWVKGLDRTITATESLLASDVENDLFRNAVIGQLVKGATDGVVDIVPKGFGDVEKNSAAETPNFRIALDGYPQPLAGLTVSDGSLSPDLTELGRNCPAEHRVDLASWVDASDVGHAISNTRGNILGEFDQVDEDKLEKAIHTYLYLGFGAEARNLISAFQTESETDPLAVGISYIVDGEPPTDNPFQGFQTCEGSAAFWALAAASPGDRLAGLNGNAVARTYMALPQPLKIALAQPIVNALMRAGDIRNAEVVRGAMTRAAPKNAAIVPLVEAEMALREGDAATAEARVNSVTDSAIASDALLVLVEARFQQRLMMEDKDLTAIEAFAFEQKGSRRDAELRRALTLAKALSGNFTEAFVIADEDIALRRDIWLVLAALGQPTDVLTHASDGADVGSDEMSPATKAIFAGKLLELGLPNVARDWLPDTLEDLPLAVEVALANKDGRTALRTLAEGSPAADPILLARAHEEVGDHARAAAILRDAGQTDDALRLERWAGLWDGTANAAGMSPAVADAVSTPMEDPGAAADVWTALARLRSPLGDRENQAPLAASQTHLEDSANTRARITDLLTTVPAVVR